MFSDQAAANQKSYVELVDQAERASQWLQASGVRVDATRVAKLVTQLRACTHPTQAGKPASATGELDPWQFADIDDLIEIHAHLSQVSDAQFFDTLKKVSSGPLLLADEAPEGGSIHARNAAFELVTAARLARAGLQVSFDTDADVTVAVGSTRVAVECKRVSSEAAVDKRIREAHKQIENRVADKEADFGVIVISLSRLLFQVASEHTAQLTGDPNVERLRFSQMLEQVGKPIVEALQKLAPPTIAIMLHYKLPFTSTVDGALTMLSRFMTYSLVPQNGGPIDAINQAMRRALESSLGNNRLDERQTS